jgi:hypothetical protein
VPQQQQQQQQLQPQHAEGYQHGGYGDQQHAEGYQQHGNYYPQQQLNQQPVKLPQSVGELQGYSEDKLNILFTELERSVDQIRLRYDTQLDIIIGGERIRFVVEQTALKSGSETFCGTEQCMLGV